VVDIGNTRLKAGIFNSDKQLEKHFYFNKPGSLQILANETQPDKIIISSVNKEWFAEEISTLKADFYTFNHDSKLPFTSKYQYNENSKAGLDRLSAISGAVSKFTNKNCLVIDCGTCITSSFINVENEFLGGSISPGLNLRFKSLHTFTSNLPLVNFEEDITYTFIGDTTENSIKNGVINGIKYEIEGIIQEYLLHFNNLEIILCGGDSVFFTQILKHKVHNEPNLVLYGLNEILTINS
jgi:type III pantothenate kinase